MKRTIIILLFSIVIPVLLSGQPAGRISPYHIEKENVLYTVGYSHLDSEWNWDYPATIDVCIRNTMEENFRLFEKYPDYVFNFTGSRRYRMMKEFYPELYKKVADYINQGRWYVSGSSVDEGEVNVSSSESVIRQVLYGNSYFRREFGKESVDYMLPDCFGFLSNMPTIWNHCGLLGFSTQKLTWNSASGLPFNVGVWNGPDGKGIIAALNATDYTGHVVPRLDRDSLWNARLETNRKNYGFTFDYRYYGVGDEGGAPRPDDVRNVVGSLHNPDSEIKVILTSSGQMYKDITPEIRAKLPVYSGDLLLIEHSAGSLTSQAYMKRSNRKNELLALSAEKVASFADWLGGAAYPFTKLNNSWDLVLGSQFHDILAGTSIPKAYEYAWNDEFVAANGFSEVMKNSLKVISHGLNTGTKGRALVVYNPVANEREDIVTAELTYSGLPENISVSDNHGKNVPVQIIERKDNKLKFIFLAKLPSVGLAVFDVRESREKPAVNDKLLVSGQTLENEYYKVRIASDGDMESIFDKKLSKELLAKPARLEFLKENPSNWPSWNMDWKDRQKPAFDFMNKETSISVLENGPVRVSLLVVRKGLNSEIRQVISLAAGEAGKRIEISNKVDWQSKEVSLKASFPLTAGNEKATYNLGVGTIQRTNNNSVKFEVPSKEWFDLTDKSGSYGVSILEDCKYGSDKPDDNTLRLTLLYTPGINRSTGWTWYQGTQDWGVHDIRYGIYAHKGDWVDGQSYWQAKFLNEPPVAFETSKHAGDLGKEISLIKITPAQAGIMAFKKMEEGDYYIVRVNELNGRDAKGLSLTFPARIVDAYEVNGQEKKIGTVDFKNNTLNFDITHYTIRSFAIRFQPFSGRSSVPSQAALQLPCNADIITSDDNRWDCNNERGGFSYPAELIPSEIISEDIRFRMDNTADQHNNAVTANGQVINLPGGDYAKLYILASSDGDTQGDFMVDDQTFNLKIQDWKGYIGQFYNRNLNMTDRSVLSIDKPFLKNSNIAWYASHYHKSYPSANLSYQYCYMYKYEINLPGGAKSIKLPVNRKIRILAATLAKDNPEEIDLSLPLSDDFHDAKSVEIRK